VPLCNAFFSHYSWDDCTNQIVHVKMIHVALFFFCLCVLIHLNLLGDNIDAIKKNMETLIDASKEVGLEVNTEKTKYMLLSRHQNAGQELRHKNS
jgi:ABC-type siderophore export system fused ATPase/permease subunit